MYISICVTMFTAMAGLLLLEKTRKENLGSLFKWVSYIILFIAGLLVVCQLVRGIGRMCHHYVVKKQMKEMCDSMGCDPRMMNMHEGMNGCGPGAMGGCCGAMNCCGPMGGRMMDKCGAMHGCDEHMMKGMKGDKKECCDEDEMREHEEMEKEHLEKPGAPEPGKK